jgi:hypothetical protein
MVGAGSAVGAGGVVGCGAAVGRGAAVGGVLAGALVGAWLGWTATGGVSFWPAQAAKAIAPASKSAGRRVNREVSIEVPLCVALSYRGGYCTIAGGWGMGCIAHRQEFTAKIAKDAKRVIFVAFCANYPNTSVYSS